MGDYVEDIKLINKRIKAEMCPYCCSKDWKWTGCDDECQCCTCKKIFPAMGIYEGEIMDN